MDVVSARITSKELAFEPPRRFSANSRKTVESTPDIVLTRTGVPNLRLKTPNHGAHAPSYDATASTRSEPIIQTAPEVISETMNAPTMNFTSMCAAPP